MTFAIRAAAARVAPSDRHVAFPGAILLGVGLVLILWALEGWGLIVNRETGVTTFPGGEGNRPVPKGTTTGGGGGAVKAQ